MLDTLRFITLSLLLAAAAVACSNAYTPTYRPAVVENVPTIWQMPSLDDKAGWCLGDRECRALAEAVVYEARGERDAGKYGVAWVIRNRAEARRWPNSIQGVIHQYRQFSYLFDKHRQKTPTKKDWTAAYIVGYDVLNDQIQSPVNDATHYHSIQVTPGWSKKLEVVVRIDNHIFYR